METNLPEKYINTKVTAGFFLLLIVAVLAFGFNYFSVVKHLINQPSDDPLGVRLVLLNELVFKIQEADRAARIYTLTGLQSDYRKHEA
jgi:CHASE3 domain sensor protein